ncbi:MAG: LysM peptidoglycan-binding domain-containing protein [Alphaproteobacteria bacterium]|nr:LysM peptidoglycan-binding domain-containing protein [Alphaproteobacteria bacterium]
MLPLDVEFSTDESQTPMLDALEEGPVGQEHKVARGENLTEIARRYGVSVKDIVAYNGLADPDHLSIGQSLRIPPARMQVADEEPGDDVYFVRRGDTLGRIADRFGVSVSELAQLNGITNRNFLKVGQPLKIPGGGASGQSSPEAVAPEAPVSAGQEEVYTVKAGDALARIAKAHGVTVQELQSLNGISNPNRIRVGQKIKIPGTGAAPQRPQSGQQRPGSEVVSDRVSEATGLEGGQVDTSQIQNGPALQAVIDSVLRVAPKDEYARGAIPGIIRQSAASNVRNANQVAYILATAEHETDFGKPLFNRSESLVEDHNGYSQRSNGTWSSTNHVTGRRVTAGSQAELDKKYWDDSYGHKNGNRKGTSDAANFRGRGYVQLTGRGNYEKMTKDLRNAGFTYEMDGVVWGRDKPIDLVANPTHVNRNKELAARCLVDGMMEGLFTGSALTSHVNDRKTDFYNARGVVNGDKRTNGRSIQRMANRYAGALKGWSTVFRGQS